VDYLKSRGQSGVPGRIGPRIPREMTGHSFEGMPSACPVRAYSIDSMGVPVTNIEQTYAEWLEKP
jgi:hypothetical protein